MKFLEFIKVLKAATKEEARKLADEHPEYRESYRTSFIDTINKELVNANVSGGIFGKEPDNFDIKFALACKWIKACKHCPNNPTTV